MEVILILLVAFQVKHFLADYVFQTEYMLGKFKENGWFGPLFSHALVHAVLTYCIAAAYIDYGAALTLAMLDLTTHFSLDKLKVEMSRNTNPKEKPFWIYLGIDQMAHHLTHYFLIYLIYLKVAT